MGINAQRQTKRSPEDQRLKDFLATRREGAEPGCKRPIDGGDLRAEGFRADMKHTAVNPLESVDRNNNPVDEWALIETRPNSMDLGVSETLFALSNGYLGLRGNPEEGRDSHTHGTFINGVHETWDIEHAEDAYGLARMGQSIVSVPDALSLIHI